MPVLKNIGQLATCRDRGAQGDLHAIRRAAMAWQAGTLLWIGPEREMPASFKAMPSHDAGGRLVIPGLVDCHTHLAYAGHRADEFQKRIAGTSYLEIARTGGGIRSTVAATREATHEQLVDAARTRLDEMVRWGVTTIECKTGYGLTPRDEYKQLEVYRELDVQSHVDIYATLLAAHIVPDEYRHHREDYIHKIIAEMIPRVADHDLATFCDVFVEDSAFTVDEARRIFAAAAEYGLKLRIHADQLSDTGGAQLAAEVGAASADHLEYANDVGLAAMAEAGVVGVMLPTATLYTFEHPADARRLMAAGIEVAVATDHNPGSAPSTNIHLALLLACTLNRMTPAEALKGATLYAARSLGESHRIGSLELGKAADFALIDAPDVDTWMYNFRGTHALATVKGGQVIAGSLDA